MKNKARKTGLGLLFALLLLISSVLPASANSAQTRWSGTSATGAVITDESCPIIVEHELLTFDIPDFPESYYNSREDFLAYPAKVTAEYTFYNPADYAVTATLVFPFGNLPDYGLHINNTDGAFQADDTASYRITVNESTVKKKLRYTLSYPDAAFDLRQDMAKLRDGYAADAFYSPDLTVTLYQFTVSGIKEESQSAATAAFIPESDANHTRLYFVEQSGGEILGSHERISAWARNGETYSVYVFGEAPATFPEWTVYENGACETETDGTVTLTDTVVMTFREFALDGYSSDSGIPEHSWYNAVVGSLNDGEWANGIIGRYRSDISDSLMRWYEYEITLQPGERITNTVTAPMYPSIDRRWEPAVYDYTYLLSPAQTWADFGRLDIVVATPYYITESEPGGFAKTENGYTLSLDGLPDSELTFTLSSSEKPIRLHSSYFPNEIILVSSAVAGALLLIGGGSLAFYRIRKKKKQEDPQ